MKKRIELRISKLEQDIKCLKEYILHELDNWNSNSVRTITDFSEKINTHNSEIIALQNILNGD